MERTNSYQQHLSAVIDAFFVAVPTMTNAQFALGAGLSKNWLSEFRASGKATLSTAEKVLTFVRANCPMGQGGDRVRALLAMLDMLEDRAA